MPRYSETLLEHARAPRNGGEMPDAHAVGTADLDGRAPRIWLYVKKSGGRITHASFQAFGCGVTNACCSVLTELITERSLVDCRKLTARDLVSALDGIPEDKRFCADLAIKALNRILAGG
jgi:nitrogen fixation NifU-like protein